MKRTTPIVGWKVFWPGAFLRFEFYNWRANDRVPLDRWLRSDRGPGFFVFLTRARAERWLDPGQGKVIRRVLVRGILVRGRIREYVGDRVVATYPSCALARWLFVPSGRGRTRGAA